MISKNILGYNSKTEQCADADVDKKHVLKVSVQHIRVLPNKISSTMLIRVLARAVWVPGGQLAKRCEHSDI